MSTWYPVSALGWLVTSVHSALTAFVVHGLWKYDKYSIEIEFFEGAVIIYMMLVLILFYARHRKVKIFHAKSQ